MKSEKKKSLMPSTAKKTGARLPMETPKGSAAIVPPAELPTTHAAAITELVRLTGLEGAAVVRHLISTSLFFVGLNYSGENSFDLLIKATMGEGNASKFKQEFFDAMAVGMEAAAYVGAREAEESRRTFSSDWPAERAEA